MHFSRSGTDNRVFYNPFSSAFWRSAAGEFSDLRKLVAAAMLIALRVAVTSLFIPVSADGRLRITFAFFINAVGGMIYGPLVSFGAGAIADIMGAIIHPTGAYFPGYTLSAALGSMIYGIFLYRVPRVGYLRLFLTKTTVNVLVNILLGSLWNSIVVGKAFYYYLAKSLVKNIVLLPLEALLLLIFLRLLQPILIRENLIPKQGQKKSGDVEEK